MKRTISVVIILLITLSLGIFESIHVSNILNKLNSEILIIHETFPDIDKDVSYLFDDIENIKLNWQKKEAKLCLVFNHRDLTTITNSLIKLSTYCKLNNYDETKIELSILYNHLKNISHSMGFNTQSIL